MVSDWHQTPEVLTIDFEIHVYDEGSKNQSLGALMELTQNLLRLKVHDKRNSGNGPDSQMRSAYL